jgi:hypothetical protein
VKHERYVEMEVSPGLLLWVTGIIVLVIVAIASPGCVPVQGGDNEQDLHADAGHVLMTDEVEEKATGEAYRIGRAVCLGDCYTDPCQSTPLEQCQSECTTWAFLELHNECLDPYISFIACKSGHGQCGIGPCFGPLLQYAACQALH